jgi:hypothetical protein
MNNKPKFFDECAYNPERETIRAKYDQLFIDRILQNSNYKEPGRQTWKIRLVGFSIITIISGFIIYILITKP